MSDFLEQSLPTPAAAVANWLGCYADLARTHDQPPTVRRQQRRAFFAARQMVVVLLNQLPGRTYVHGADRVTLAYDREIGHWYPSWSPAHADAG